MKGFWQRIFARNYKKKVIPETSDAWSMINPSTQHIILKIVGYLEGHEIDRNVFYKRVYPIVVFYSCEYSQLIG